MIEFLKLYPWEDYRERLSHKIIDGVFIPRDPHPDLRFFSRVGNVFDNDYAVFFKTEGDMIAHDNWNNIPSSNSQELIDKGRNLHNKIWQK